jgi:hypothetical protein
MKFKQVRRPRREAKKSKDFVDEDYEGLISSYFDSHAIAIKGAKE